MAFGPDMKPLETESTALCGIAYYGDTKFPKEFQGNFFIGDAVSSRVHRYTWENKGSSPVGKSETDLVKSTDPWFRPVNVKLGPDGALYLADRDVEFPLALYTWFASLAWVLGASGGAGRSWSASQAR